MEINSRGGGGDRERDVDETIGPVTFKSPLKRDRKSNDSDDTFNAVIHALSFLSLSYLDNGGNTDTCKTYTLATVRPLLLPTNLSASNFLSS